MIDSIVGKLTFSKIDALKALKAGLAMNRGDIIAQVQDSGIRGRGGAGFPTSIKWNLAAAAKSEQKFIICNADEGEPGTFKDRVILMDFPDLVFSAMTIAAKAIGATQGIVYLRGEYTYMRKTLEDILQKRRDDNLLGENILKNKGLNFDIKLQMGSGAYVCGEETALIESMEGNRGEPRNRPPFPVDTGFMGRPTVVNNVETLAWITSIFDKGTDWFKKFGTEKSTGLKLFSVSGDCEKPGVYEFPMGITISKLLKAVGAQDAKAVQIGGASGHCVPAEDFDRCIAYEDVSTGGSIIIFGPQRDMLEVAENFLDFFVDESCGQCTPCREGNPKLLEGVKMLRKGECSMQYLNELCSLGETMKTISKCGLGQSSPNAFLSIVKHYRHEIMGRPLS